MCKNCWIEYGSHSIINERTVEAARLIRELYDTENGGVGGYGHVIFDDWNIDYGGESSELKDAKANKWPDNICEETRLASIAALEYFDKLTVPERNSALALVDNFINHPQA